MKPPSDAPQEQVAHGPPFLGSWRNVYALVLGELCVLVALMYALARWAS